MSRMLILTVALAVVGSAVAARQLGAQAPQTTAPDIVGFRAGMPLVEAYKLLKAYKPKGTFVVGEALIPELSAQKLPHRLLFTDMDVAGGESIQLDVTLPPNPQVVWMVQRRVQFARGSEVLMDELMGRLRDKYGREPSGAPRAPTYWLFDARGQGVVQTSMAHCSILPAAYAPAAPLPVDSGAIQIPRPAPDVKPPVIERAGFKSCAPLTLVTVSFGFANTLVQTMDLSLVDRQLAVTAHQASYDQIARVRSGQDAKEIQELKQRPIPTL